MAGLSDTFWLWVAHESILSYMKSMCERPAILEESGNLSLIETIDVCLDYSGWMD